MCLIFIIVCIVLQSKNDQIYEGRQRNNKYLRQCINLNWESKRRKGEEKEQTFREEDNERWESISLLHRMLWEWKYMSDWYLIVAVVVTDVVVVVVVVVVVLLRGRADRVRLSNCLAARAQPSQHSQSLLALPPVQSWARYKESRWWRGPLWSQLLIKPVISDSW